MAYVNIQRRHVRFKVVYYGPKESGKTANLQWLSSLTKDKVDVLSLDSSEENPSYFDYMPLNLGDIRGLKTMFKLYTMPGNAENPRSRQSLLKDVDGIIFVADSRNGALDANIASLNTLKEDLAAMGANIETLPVVLQLNKRDLEDIHPVETLKERLNLHDWPCFETNAINGTNVKDSMGMISQLVYKQAVTQYSLIPSDIPPPEEVDEVQAENQSKPFSKETKDKGQALLEAAGDEASPDEADRATVEVSTGEMEKHGFEEQPGVEAEFFQAGEDKAGPNGAEDYELELPDDDMRTISLPAEEGAELSFEDRETAPPSEMSRGMAEIIRRTVPPPSSLRTMRRPSQRRGEGVSALSNQAAKQIDSLEVQIGVRFDRMDGLLHQMMESQLDQKREGKELSDAHARLQNALDEISEMFGDLTVDFRGFERAIEVLRETISKMIRAQVESHFAEYLEELGEDDQAKTGNASDKQAEESTGSD